MEHQKLTTILFDLDGTLLPMDNDTFTRGYFKLLAARLAPLGYEPAKLVDSIWAGTAAMVKNDGSQNNETAFWKRFSEIYGEQVLDDLPVFEDFYATDFQKGKELCGFQPKAAQAVREVKKLGLRAALATNPISRPSPPKAASAGPDWNRRNLNFTRLMKISGTASPIPPTIRSS